MYIKCLFGSSASWGLVLDRSGDILLLCLPQHKVVSDFFLLECVEFALMTCSWDLARLQVHSKDSLAGKSYWAQCNGVYGKCNVL